MKRLTFLLMAPAFLVVSAAAVAALEVPIASPQPQIDVVFCIDCSGSMGPVIETAKQKVWTLVNEIAKAKPTPVLRIGLLGYGDADQKFRKFELSEDLDDVYKNLMTFKDEGWGREFVGLAIHKATTEMKWISNQKSLKVIYVVGNETARQGPVEFDYSRTAPNAIKADIIVNAVYCGDVAGRETWREFARLADGQYMEIAGNGGAITVQTPFDQKLDVLSGRLNLTYIPFGSEGQLRQQNQVTQDANARAGGSAVAADRALSKTASLYNNRSWCLVEASRAIDFDWAKIKDADLPIELRKLNLEQRRAFVDRKWIERTTLQKEIKELSLQRQAFIAEETRKRGLKGDQALDAAVRQSLKSQAEKKGFRFDRESP